MKRRKQAEGQIQPRMGYQLPEHGTAVSTPTQGRLCFGRAGLSRLGTTGGIPAHPRLAAPSTCPAAEREPTGRDVPVLKDSPSRLHASLQPDPRHRSISPAPSPITSCPAATPALGLGGPVRVVPARSGKKIPSSGMNHQDKALLRSMQAKALALRAILSGKSFS